MQDRTALPRECFASNRLSIGLVLECCKAQVQAGAAHAESRGISAEAVAAIVAKTLDAPKPRTRQVVGTAAAIQMAVRRSAAKYEHGEHST